MPGLIHPVERAGGVNRVVTIARSRGAAAPAE
jgi:hypothetical protein